MELKSLIVMFLVLTPVISAAWRSSRETRREPREMRRGVHYHTKRHMLPPEPEVKKRSTTVKPQRDIRKKPSGHLTPLQDEDMENDEVVSVAIGPPPMRPKFEKPHRKPSSKPPTQQVPNSTAINLVRDVLAELTKEFLTKDVNENFVFGQYVGNAMKNLTSDLRLGMQHDILEILVKYQKLNADPKGKETQKIHMLQDNKIEKTDRGTNNTIDTDENWPDFSNLAKIVG